MAYRLTGTDPFLRAAVGAFNGYAWRQNPSSGAALLKRRSASAWHGIYVIDQGTTTNYAFAAEFGPGNNLASDPDGSHPFTSTATFNDTTNWMIVGWTWDGAATAGHWVWRWKIGAGAWSNEANTANGVNTATIGSGYRHLVGNEAGLLDDADFDIVCIGSIKSNLAQATFESLDMLSFATWQAVFTGSSAWLLGFDTIATQTDRTGNGGDEVSRSAGITLVADPAGWSWGGVVSVPAVQAQPWLPMLQRFVRPGLPQLGFPPPCIPVVVTDVFVPVSAAVAGGATPVAVLKVDVPAVASLAAGSTPAPVVKDTVAPAATTGLGVSPAPAVVVNVSMAAAVAAGSTPAPVVVDTALALAALAAGVTPAAVPAVITQVTAALAAGSSPTPVVQVVIPFTAATAAGSTPAPTVIVGSAVTVVVSAALAAGAAPVPAVLISRSPAAANAAGVTPTPTVAELVQVAAALAAGGTAAPVVIQGVIATPGTVTVTETGGPGLTVTFTAGPDVTVDDVAGGTVVVTTA